MRYFLAIVLIVGWIVVQAIYATSMKKAAVRKGYGDDAHAWALCFWLGILGGLYVAALPDLIQQNQNQQLIELMKEAQRKND